MAEQDDAYTEDDERKRQFQDVFAGGAFLVVCLGLLILTIVAVLYGNPKLLGDENNKGDWIGEGFLQTMDQVQVIFLVLPVQTFLIGLAWTVSIAVFAKIAIPLSLVSGFLLMFSGTAFLFFHASKHEYFLLHFVAVVLFGCCGIYAFVTWRNRNNIDLTTAFIEEGLHPFREGAVVMISLFVIALQLTFWLFWTITAISLFSFPDSHNILKIDFSTRWVALLLFLGGYWVWHFLGGLMATTISGTVAHWYFKRGGESVASERPLMSFVLAGTYSFGSVAFAAIVVDFMESVTFLQRALETTPHGREVVTRVVGAVSCFQMAPFLNRYAYVYIAMHGYPFLHSARETYRLFARNEISSMITKHYITSVAWSGRMCSIGAALLLLGYAVKDNNQRLHVVTVVLSAVISCGIFDCFSALTSYSADAVMVCYCQDLEKNRNTEGNILSKNLNRVIQEFKDTHAGSDESASHEYARVAAHESDNL